MEENVTVEELHKEIDLIQSCVSRMSNNSFYLKGWLVSVVAILIVISPEDTNKFPILVASLLLTVCFWYLDAFYLRSEKLYRKMYLWTLEYRKDNFREFQYDLNLHRFESEVEKITKIMSSKTLLCFYGTVILIIFVFTIYYKFSV